MGEPDPFDQIMNVAQTQSNNMVTSLKSTQSQTERSKIPKQPKPVKHAQTNTRVIRSVDKATNTEPLIILSPDEISKMGCGAHLLTFNKNFQIFMTTNNSHSSAANQQQQMAPSQQIAVPNQLEKAENLTKF